VSALRELLAIFDIHVDDAELKEGHKHVESFAKTLGEVAKTVGEAFAVKEVYEFVHSQIEAAAHVQDLAERLDVSATALSNFGFVAKGAGIDLDTSARSLGFLEKNLGDAATKGGESAAMFSRLHVSIKDAHGAARPLTDVLADVADGIQKLPDANQRAAASMAILGREGKAFVPILAKGGGAMRAALADADALGNGLGDAYFEDAKKAREESEKLGRVIQSLKDRAIAVLLPYVTELTADLKDVSKWMLENAKTTKALEWGVAALAVVVGVALVDALWSAAAAAGVLDALIAPETYVVLALAAAIAGVVWVVQDLVSMVRGGNSVLGDFAEQLDGVTARTTLIQGLAGAWAEVTTEINDVAYALGYFVGIWIGVGKAFAKVPIGREFLDTMKELGFDLDDSNTFALVLIDSMKILANVVLGMVPGLDALRTLGQVIGIAHDRKLSTSAADYVGPDAAAAAPGPWADPGKHRATAPEQRGDERGAGTWGGRPFRAPHVGGGIAHAEVRGGAPHAGGGGGTVIHQGPVSVVVNTKSDKPKEVGDEAGAKVGAAVSNRKTLASVVRP
jgi:hypothetical protein